MDLSSVIVIKYDQNDFKDTIYSRFINKKGAVGNSIKHCIEAELLIFLHIKIGLFGFIKVFVC